MKPDRNLIFDIGMHIGQDTDFYLKKGFKVVAVEANPALAAQNTERFAAAIADGRLAIVDKALGAEAGRTKFYVNNQVSEWSSVNKTLGQRAAGATEIDIEMTTIGDLFGRYGVPYYMKIDIEGADLLPIKGLRGVPVRPVHVSYEAANIDGAVILANLGYAQFKLVDQRELPVLSLPKPALEGEYAEHTFPLGSSGPFGEETPGPWGTLEQAITDYVLYKHFRRVDTRRKQTWTDFHARSEWFARMFADAPDRGPRL